MSVGYTQSKMMKVLRAPCAPLRLRRRRRRYVILLVYAMRRFAPYFEIASGVGRFRGPGGRGTSATPELTTLPHHILTLTTVRLKS